MLASPFLLSSLSSCSREQTLVVHNVYDISFSSLKVVPQFPTVENNINIATLDTFVAFQYQSEFICAAFEY